jgi:hypothetical protein
MDRRAPATVHEMRMLEGDASRMAEEATESLAVAGALTQHVVHTMLELEAHAGQEGARCLAEQYRIDIDMVRELQEAALRWPTTWPEMLRDPMRWCLHSLEQQAALTQTYLGAVRQNAEAVTQCLRRIETSAAEATHAVQKAFKDAGDRAPDVLATPDRLRAG